MAGRREEQPLQPREKGDADNHGEQVEDSMVELRDTYVKPGASGYWDLPPNSLSVELLTFPRCRIARNFPIKVCRSLRIHCQVGRLPVWIWYAASPHQPQRSY